MLRPMPAAGASWEDLEPEMIRRGEGDAQWREGKTAVYVFNAGEDVATVQKEAYALYMSENGLGPLAFPSLKQMEDEVIGMGLWLLHGDDDCVGQVGGESHGDGTRAGACLNDQRPGDVGIRGRVDSGLAPPS